MLVKPILKNKYLTSILIGNNGVVQLLQANSYESYGLQVLTESPKTTNSRYILVK